MERRNFLKNSLLFGAGLALNNVSFAKIEGKVPNFVFVLLRGAADGLSMLVPYNDNYYYDARKNIAIPKEKCIEINNTFGLNPALNYYSELYKDNQIAFIPAAGQNENSRSHFLSQAILEYGTDHVAESGFLARLTEVMKVKTISFTENISEIIKSKNITIPNITENHIDGYYNYSDKYNSDLSLISGVENNLNLIKEIQKTKFDRSTKFSKVAQLMKMTSYNTVFIDLGDWDTHSSQGSLDGKMNELLLNLNSNINSFRETIGSDWDNTVMVIMSEFGRTLKENGNGTDHGHGNLITVLGGMVNKSQIAGHWLILSKENLHEGRDLPVFYDYRSILSEIFVKTYGLNQSQLNYIFPNVKPSSFSLV